VSVRSLVDLSSLFNSSTKPVISFSNESPIEDSPTTSPVTSAAWGTSSLRTPSSSLPLPSPSALRSSPRPSQSTVSMVDDKLIPPLTSSPWTGGAVKTLPFSPLELIIDVLWSLPRALAVRRSRGDVNGGERVALGEGAGLVFFFLGETVMGVML